MLEPTAPLPPPLTAQWRQQGFLGDERIGWLLEAAARRWPDRQAIVTAAEALTFRELEMRSRAIAAQLVAHGVAPGDAVTWTLPNGVDAVALPAAIWRIGAVSSPVVSIYRAHELSFILGQIRPAALVVPDEHRGRRFTAEIDEVLDELGHRPAARLSPEGHGGWTALARDGAAAVLPDDVRPAPAGDVCTVLYTSGTTAAPKGVLHTGAALLHETREMALQWGLTWRDALFMASPLTHITGLLQGFLLPVLVGGRAVLQDRFEPAAAASLVDEHQVTYMAGATPFLRGIVDEFRSRGTRPRTLRQFTSGGAAVPPDLIAEADELGISAHRMWGMTELPTATRANELDDFELRAHTDGGIAWPVEVQAVDEERRPLPPGAEGELRLRGPERMVGYVDARLNDEVLDDEGWFYSGDIGRVDELGRVVVVGRTKEIINRGGEKFSVRDIEEMLLRHPSVSEAVVVGVPDQRLGERVGAAVVLDGPADAKDTGPWQADLAAFLEEQGIARQKIPTEIIVLDELPKTPTGKLQRFRILEEWERS